MGIISFRSGWPRYYVSMNFRLPAAQLVWARQLANEASLEGSASRVLAAFCVSFEFLPDSSIKITK